MTKSKLTLADEVFLHVAQLHRDHPDRFDFSTSEVVERAQKDRLSDGDLASLRTHLSRHTIANKEPNPGRHRMLFSTGQGRVRLLNPGDEVHPERTGRQFPDEADLSPEHRELVRWAKERYEALACQTTERRSRKLMDLAGALKGAYRGVDSYVRELRSGWGE